MPREASPEKHFDKLCADCYPKVLRYLFAVLADEQAARDCAQDVFLTAYEKRVLLVRHPNPAGFLFQTAKLLAKRRQREGLRRLLRESGGDPEEAAVAGDRVETLLDRQVNELDYLEAVLSQLDGEKRRLYDLYYLGGRSMGEIARLLHLEETAVRMRFVRLRREIKAIVCAIAEEHFP